MNITREDIVELVETSKCVSIEFCYSDNLTDFVPSASATGEFTEEFKKPASKVLGLGIGEVTDCNMLTDLMMLWNFVGREAMSEISKKLLVRQNGKPSNSTLSLVFPFYRLFNEARLRFFFEQQRGTYGGMDISFNASSCESIDLLFKFVELCIGLGVDSYVEAVVKGVPIEDILA